MQWVLEETLEGTAWCRQSVISGRPHIFFLTAVKKPKLIDLQKPSTVLFTILSIWKWKCFCGIKHRSLLPNSHLLVYTNWFDSSRSDSKWMFAIIIYQQQPTLQHFKWLFQESSESWMGQGGPFNLNAGFSNKGWRPLSQAMGKTGHWGARFVRKIV